MNPEVIYTNYRDAALAELLIAESYVTFVAMPFREKCSYHPKQVLENIIQKAAEEANKKKAANLNNFLKPQTVGDLPGTANVITEDIVKGILYSHFFLADLTDGNAGVLLEAGIAMAFKPNSRIILITEHPLSDLHFDIRNNRVISYAPDGNINAIRDALLEAANSFEGERSKYITQVSQHLSADAIMTLEYYGSLYQKEMTARSQPGFHYNNIPKVIMDMYGEQAITIFRLTLQELQDKRLLWTDYSTSLNDKEGMIQHWAAHLTKLGWLIIKHYWPHYKPDLCERIR